MFSWEQLVWEAVVSGTAGFVSVAVLASRIIAFLRRKGVVRPDAHKPGKPLVAHSGGLIIFTGLTFSLALLLFLILFSQDMETFVKMVTIYFSGLICFIIGLYDDIKVLKRGFLKMLLTVTGIAPILLFHFLFPKYIVLGRPVLPIIGPIRITIIYWLLLPFAVAGAANVVNMLDIFNGVIPGMAIIAMIGLLASSIILGSIVGFMLSIILLSVLAAYFPYNKYPAKVFNGDSGSLLIGGLLGALAVVERIEYVVLSLLLIHIINGFMVLVSFGGFREHREVKKRPIIVLEDGSLTANLDPDAPWSLTRLILSVAGKSSEKEISKFYIVSQIVPSLLAVITALLMR